MPQRISPEQHIESFFTRESQDKCIAQLDRINLQMRTRFKDMQEPKRGRPRRKKGKPPITPQDPVSEAEFRRRVEG